MIRGFSTLEILIALAIATTSLISITLLPLGMPSVLAGTKAHREALAIARSDLARSVAISHTDFSAVASVATTTTDDYTHALVVANISDDFTKRLTSSVSWNDASGRVQTTVLSTLITDYQHASASSCDSFLTGDWQS